MLSFILPNVSKISQLRKSQTLTAVSVTSAQPALPPSKKVSGQLTGSSLANVVGRLNMSDGDL